jgi:aminoacylase
MEAIRKLHTSQPDYQPKRSIYLSFVPDEEVGGAGMAALLSSELYKALPGIAIALDEGLASTTDTYSVFYGERLPWWVEVTASGNTGHGSRFIEHTAVEQIIEIANKALAFREGQRSVLHGSSDEAKHANCSHAVAAKKRRMAKGSEPMTLGDVTSLNITTLQAGVRSGDSFVTNCVPPTASCSLDIRISPHVQPEEIKAMLDGWCKDCSASEEEGHKLSWDYIGGHGNDLQQHALTSTDVRVNPWYDIFGKKLEAMGMKYTPEVFPAATDSRFLRALGIRALGFSPMKNSEIMLHENNEYLGESVFLEGIGVYVGLIESLGKQGAELDVEADGKSN